MSKSNVRIVGDYAVIDDVWYERVSNKSVNLELDLEEDVLDKIDSLIEDGKFVSRGDAIRTVLRDVIKENEELLSLLEDDSTKVSKEKSMSKNTKKPGKKPSKKPAKPAPKAPPMKPVKSPGRRSR